MKFIQVYNSDSEDDCREQSPENPGTAAGDSNKEVSVRAVRKVYLITYSQADMQKFPRRLSFAKEDLCSFLETPAGIVQCCCSREDHKKAGCHYHMAIKLDRNERWVASKRF